MSDSTTGQTSFGYTCPACGTWVYPGAHHVCPGNIATWPLGQQQQGWLCPKCQKAHAPWVQTCPVNAPVFVTGMSVAGEQPK